MELTAKPHCNEANMRLVIEHLKAEDLLSFDMSNWVSECGTAGCIAGTAAVASGMSLAEIYDTVFKDKSAEFLGLDDKQAEQLFLLKFSGVDVTLEDVELHHAIEACENVLECGDPMWRDVLNQVIAKKECPF